MIAIPSGASGSGTSQRWIKNCSPGNHAKVTRAPISAEGRSLKVATSRHAPTNGLRASSEAPLLIMAAIAVLLLYAVHADDIPSAFMGCGTGRVRRWDASGADHRDGRCPVGTAAAAPAQRHRQKQ